MLPLLALGIYFVSLFGWGRLVAGATFGHADLSLANRSPTKLYPALTAALGLLPLALIGGLLNATHLISGIVLEGLVVVGWVSALAFGWRDRRVFRSALATVTPRDLPRLGLLLALAVFFSAALLPGYSFNVYDDFRAYLVAPVRMLALGSLAGNPFDGLGTPALGLQAFFQAFAAARFPLPYMVGFDSVLCLVLAAAAVGELARYLGAGRAAQVLATIVFLIVNPGTVNLTSVFSASLLLILIVALTIDFQRTGTVRSAVLLGASLAALVILKSTYLFTAGAYCVFIVALAVVLDRAVLNTKRLYLVAGTAILCLAPWIAVYLPDAVTILPILGDKPLPIPPFVQTGGAPSDLTSLLSFGQAFYGGPYGAYGVGFVVAVVLPAVILRRLFTSHADRRRLAIPVLALSVGGVVAMLAQSCLTDFEAVLRFSGPALATSLALLTAELAAEGAGEPARPVGFDLGSLRRMGIIAAPILSALLFVANAWDRTIWAYANRSQISFPAAQQADYRTFVETAFSPSYKSWITGIQNGLAEHETILAWHSAPFLMDYQRNRVFTFNEQGYVNPLFRFPPDGSLGDVTDALKRAGIRYIMWEHLGYTTWTEATYLKNAYSPFALIRTQQFLMLRMWSYMRKVAEATQPVYLDGRMAVFDVQTIAF